MTEYSIHITLADLCHHTDTPQETIVEFVELGILEPVDQTQTDWIFAVETVQIIRRANRLHQDLGINWAGVALALDLLSQREQLQLENQALRQRLQRFLLDEN